MELYKSPTWWPCLEIPCPEPVSLLVWNLNPPRVDILQKTFKGSKVIVTFSSPIFRYACHPCVTFGCSACAVLRV